MSAVGDLEFGEDVGDMVTHGLRAEEEAAGDLRVTVTPGDEVEDLALAGGKLGEGICGVGPKDREEASDATRDLRSELASPFATAQRTCSMSEGSPPLST